MSVPVLTAVTGSAWEATFVAGLEQSPASGITVVRRCVDLPELLAVAATGTARAVLVSADLRRLDRDALSRLAASDVAVVGLHSAGDEAGETRLRQLGIRHVVPAESAPEHLAAAVELALADRPSAASSALLAYSRPIPAGDGGLGAEQLDAPPVEAGTGRLVAVWGPAGAPGRTTVAVGLAGALATSGGPTLLADADVYGGAVAQVLGLLDEAPGLAAAARMANNGALDLLALARVAPEVVPHLRVLTGIARQDRWPELRPAALEQVWEQARSLARTTVVDCAFSLEQDEELAFDTMAPRRNGATLATLAAADTVLAVGSADPVGVQRLVRGLEQLRDVVPQTTPRVVLNRLRRSAVGLDPERQLREALDRYVGVRDVWFLPYDREALDAAVLRGRLLHESAPSAPVTRALDALAAAVSGRPAAHRRAGRLRLGR